METITDLPRKAQRLPIELRVHVVGPDGHETLLMSHDWSVSGVFLRTRHPFAVGTTVRLSLLLPGARAPVAFHGLVVRAVLEGDPEHHRPPGMGLRVPDPPPPLLAYLRDAARQTAVLNPDALLVELPTLLIAGGERPERLRYAVYLDAHGYDVSDADSPDEVFALLDKGVDPVAWVLIDDDGELSVPLQKRMMGRHTHHLPRAVVIIGQPHGTFEGELRHPLEMLPRHTDPAAVKHALDQQLRSPPLLVEPLSVTDAS